MGIVKSPALSLDASGNVGPICFSKWRGLSIARGVWTGTVPNTSKQQIIQGYMRDVSRAWSNLLTALQRELWSQAARGQTVRSRVDTLYVPTGYQHYMTLNLQVVRQGLPIEVEPPIKLVPYGFERILVQWNLFQFWVDILFLDHFVNAPSGFQGEIWRAGPYSTAGRHAIEPEFKFLSYADLIMTYNDMTVLMGNYYWYRCRWVESKGRRGNWFEMQVFTG